MDHQTHARKGIFRSGEGWKVERLEEKLHGLVEEIKRKGEEGRRKLCSREAFSRALLCGPAPHQAPEKGPN